MRFNSLGLSPTYPAIPEFFTAPSSDWRRGSPCYFLPLAESGYAVAITGIEIPFAA